MIRSRRIRIVATIGPASRAPEMVEKLIEAGVDVFRLNFSHGEAHEHAAACAAIRAAEAKSDRPVGVLADLQGPKLRIGRFKEGAIALARGQALRLDLDPAPGDATRAPAPHPEIFAALRPGALLLADDGKVRLRVGACGPDFAETVVEEGVKLSNGKGLALPGAAIPLSALTPKDRADLEIALGFGVDWVALSFVQRAADMAELRQLVAGRAAVLAKIEKPAALDQLEPILDLCDGVMVARGDLGVEAPPEEVPIIQKTIIRAARRRGVPVIVATQMLESMTAAPTPTRAEASDVANAVYEGADAVMLSAESAVGQFPVEAVSMMGRIAERVQADPSWGELMEAERAGLEEEDVDALVAAARRACDSASTACLVVFTTLGGTARRMARTRPMQPILALTPNAATARRLTLVWGLETRLEPQPETLEEVTERAVSAAVRLGIAAPTKRILVLAGTPFGAPGAANLLRLAHAPAFVR